MDIIKKNLWSIIWGVVAIICLIVPFWPMGGYRDELHTQAEARAAVHHDLTGLLTRHRPAPVIDPDNPREADLGIFPNDALIKAADAALSKLATESQKLQQYAEAMNSTGHKPLVPEALPKRTGTVSQPDPDFTVRLRFKDKYFIAAPGGILDILKAGMPPSLEQITAAKAAVEQAIKDSSPVVGGQPQVNQAAIAEAQLNVPGQMKLEAATKCMIYVDPAVVARHSDMDMLGGQAPTVRAIWNAQLWHWIQEDIAHAIANVNRKAGAQDVRGSLIKRIRKLDIEALDKDPIKWSLSKTADGKLTEYKPDEDAMPRRFEVSPSGRISCGLYDVIRFRLDMDVDAIKVNSILQDLSHKNFLTVLAVQHVHGVDRAVEQAGEGPGGGYMYGDNPVVNIVVDCELLYLRSWTIPYMPDEVKKDYTDGVQMKPR